MDEETDFKLLLLLFLLISMSLSTQNRKKITSISKYKLKSLNIVSEGHISDDMSLD